MMPDLDQEVRRGDFCSFCQLLALSELRRGLLMAVLLTGTASCAARTASGGRRACGCVTLAAGLEPGAHERFLSLGMAWP